MCAEVSVSWFVFSHVLSARNNWTNAREIILSILDACACAGQLDIFVSNSSRLCISLIILRRADCITEMMIVLKYKSSAYDKDLFVTACCDNSNYTVFHKIENPL